MRFERGNERKFLSPLANSFSFSISLFGEIQRCVQLLLMRKSVFISQNNIQPEIFEE
jgi:sulfur relay (sulfurtransferase) complex TusBCD TusD component (DsrE family)